MSKDTAATREFSKCTQDIYELSSFGTASLVLTPELCITTKPEYKAKHHRNLPVLPLPMPALYSNSTVPLLYKYHSDVLTNSFRGNIVSILSLIP